MSGRKNENLKELFERFINNEQAKKAVEDIEKAEQILREYPAPEPDDMLIANIKAEIAMRLQQSKAHVFKRVAYKVAVAAAAIIILAVTTVRLFEIGGGEPEVHYASIMPTIIWESEDISTDDSALAILTAEIEQIESEILALQLGENGGNGETAVTELEMELVDINIDFWKG